MVEHFGGPAETNGKKSPREEALERVIEQHFGTEYAAYFEGHDLTDRIGAVFNMLQAEGEDPAAILMESGVMLTEDINEV